MFRQLEWGSTIISEGGEQGIMGRMDLRNDRRVVIPLGIMQTFRLCTRLTVIGKSLRSLRRNISGRYWAYSGLCSPARARL